VIVTRLELSDFRNYESADVELRPGPNLVVGSNGQGKTNLVESLAYLATLGSHRVSSDQALIRAGTEAAVIRARLEHGSRSVLVEVQLNRGSANRAQVNRAAIKPRELPRYVSTALFAPEDLALVRGDPSGRRRFLDQLLVQSVPRLAGTLADYDRVVRQRTSLLKSARAARLSETQLSTLDVWDERLVGIGTEILVARADLVERLGPLVAEAYAGIAGADHEPRLEIRSSILGAQPDDEGVDARDGTVPAMSAAEVATAFGAAVLASRRSELDRGVTLVGPHRDDLLIGLKGLPARGFASHGESWSLALALRLASASLLKSDSPLGDPVIILDDVFAELDEGRREHLADAIAGYEQVLVTAAVLDDVPERLRSNVVRIEAGRVVGEES
jgi:DNA replication and repair protein RecF